MKAIRFYELGGPEVLRLEDVPTPEPGPGQVRVKVRFAGINFADTLFHEGRYFLEPELPDTPGLEASGVVEAVGPHTSGVEVGQRVAFMHRRTYAEQVVVPVEHLMALPEAVTFEQGAALPVQALTAYHLLHTAHQVEPGQTVLVHAAAGGLGQLLVQMAKRAGATVYGTTSTADKAEVVKRRGADAALLYADFVAEVRRLTGGRGVDLVLDGVGRETFDHSLEALAPFGRLLTFGIASGTPRYVNPVALMPRCLSVSGFVLYTVFKDKALHARGLETVLSWLAAGELELQIGATWPLEQAAEAHRKLRERHTTGKLLLEV
jgi:NADPH2:quinone reductase